MESHLVQVVCVHIRGVSAIQGAGLEGFHCIGMSNCNVCSCYTLVGMGLETPKFKKKKMLHVHGDCVQWNLCNPTPCEQHNSVRLQRLSDYKVTLTIL